MTLTPGASKAKRDRRAAEGLCRRCGKAPAEPDRVACRPCLLKVCDNNKRWYATRNGREKVLARSAARADAGLCIACGKRPPLEGYRQCTECRDQRRAYQRDYRRKTHPDAVPRGPRLPRAQSPSAGPPTPAPVAAPLPALDGEIYIRACIAHRCRLNGLDCERCPPRSHGAVLRDESPGWLVVHASTGRIAGTVHGDRVAWEAWSEDECQETLTALSGRRSDGQAHSALELREQRRKGARASWKKRRPAA